MPPMDEMMRLFAGYGCEILGPPLSLSDLSRARPTASPARGGGAERASEEAL